MKMLALIAAICFSPSLLSAQGTADSPVAHMEYLTGQDQELSKKYLSYMSEVAHGGRARKMEKRREELLSSIKDAVRDCSKLKPYKGDASLRDAYKEYYSMLYSIFNEDYHKIVDMEEIAERSYDAMEAYLLVQEQADQKLDEANQKLRTAYDAFAAAHGVRLVEGPESKLNRKLVKVGRVNAYMHQVYLIFFKSSVQETLMLEAIHKKDITTLEQHKNSLLKFSTEGLSRLDTVKAYNGDGSLVTACRKVLEFHKAEAQNKIGPYTDFLMKEAEFTKMKKSFESKGSSKTNDEVKNFNAAVTAFNNAITQFNKLNDELNNSRSKVMANWENTRKRFMDHHVPH